MRYDCLIVDDEEPLSQSTREYFELFGLHTAYVLSAQACTDFLKTHTADIILLDINLKEESGFSLCKKLRNESDVPILFISARTSDDDVLLALGIGGDDYIQKPYSLNVLLAKVKAMLKRCRSAPDDMYHFGMFTLDFAKEKVTSPNGEIKLKAMEYRLLLYLIKNRGRVISKDELFHHVWNDSLTGDNTLNVHIRRLREKIEADPNQPEYIKTIWGTGYRFEEP